MTELLRELEAVVLLVAQCESRSERMETADDMHNFIRTHHATIAQNAEDSKRLKALEQAMEEAKCDPQVFVWICKRADEIMRGGE